MIALRRRAKMNITSTNTVSVKAAFFWFLRLLKNDSVTNPVTLAGYLIVIRIMKLKTLLYEVALSREELCKKTDMSFRD
jgi:hypothetical protein